MQVLIGSNNLLSKCHQMTALLKEKPQSVPQHKKRHNNLLHNSPMQVLLRISLNSILAQQASIVSSWQSSFIAPFPPLMMSVLITRTSKRRSPATPKSLLSSSSASRPPITRSNFQTCLKRTLVSNMIKTSLKRVSSRSSNNKPRLLRSKRGSMIARKKREN